MTRIRPFKLERLEPRRLLVLYGLDPDFASGGVADIDANLLMQILPDDKILVVGTIHTPGTGGDDPGYDNSYARRLNPDGTPDNTFGDDGSVYLGESFAQSLVAGSYLYVLQYFYSDDDEFTSLIRYTLDGEFDANYHPAGDNQERYRAFQPSPDGGFFTVGTQIVVKYKPDGSLDTSFGNAGAIELPTDVYAYGAIATTHGIVFIKQNIDATEYTLTRYKLDGSGVDLTFGNAGSITISDAHTTLRLAEQSDGNLIAVEGRDNGPTPVARIRRFNVNGSVDASYGNNGVAELNETYQYESVASIEIDDQDRLLISTYYSLYRFTTAGQLEPAPFNGFLRAYQGSIAAVEIEVDDEGRILLGAANHVVRLNNLQPTQIGRENVLYVHGDDADDTVTIAAGSNNKINVTLNGTLTSYDADDIAGFNLRLNEGKHTVNVSVDLPTSVTTGAGDDSVTTADGNDSIFGGTGENTIACGDGNDTIELGDETKRQQITGGDGNKKITIGGGPLTANLGVGDSDITTSYQGGANNITIAGGNNKVGLYGASDVLTIGGNGHNVVTVSALGVSTITTGDGPDSISIASAGIFNSGGGNDSITVSATAAHGAPPGSGFYGTVTVFCGDGDDRAVTTASYETDPVIFGGNGNDTMIGGVGSQTLYGNAGRDILRGGDSSDLLSGGGGHDRLFGEAGKDRLYGGDGWDTLDGGTGDDRLFGHNDRDHLLGNAGNDFLSGGASNDWLYGNTGNDLLNGDGGNDRLYSDDDNGGVDTLHGGAGDDYLVGQDGVAEQLFGDRGRDSYVADDSDTLTGLEVKAPTPPPLDLRFQNFAPMGPERTIASDPMQFDTATTPSGDFLIAAATATGSPGSFNIVATRFSSTGAQMAETLMLDSINEGDGAQIMGVSVAIDADGDAVVVYCVGLPPYTWHSKLYFVRISKAGVASAPVLAGEGGISDPDVSMDASGGFFLGWITGKFNNEGPVGVHMRAYDATGTPRAPEFTVADGDEDFLVYELYGLGELEIVSKLDGAGAIFTFGEIGASYSVTYIRFGQTSTTARIGALQVVGNVSETSSDGALAMYPDGSFLIGYAQGQYGQGQMLVQRHDKTGQATGGLIPIAKPTEATLVQSLALDTLPDGGFIAAYIESSSKGNVVFARRDNRYELSDPIEITRLTDVVSDLRLAADDNGSAVFAYRAGPPFTSPQDLRFRRASAELAAVDQGKLYVFGSPNDDSINIRTQSDNLIVTRNTRSIALPAAGVSAIATVGLTDKDSLDNDTSLKVT